MLGRCERAMRGKGVTFAVLFASAAMTLAACDDKPAPPQQSAAPPAVIVTRVARQPISQGEEFIGRVEAVDKVDIRARVTGYLEEVQFQDGMNVKEGMPLYRIEKGPFEAAVEQAQGVLEGAKGTLQNATVQRQRAEDLLMGAPSEVTPKQLRELHIRLNLPE